MFSWKPNLCAKNVFCIILFFYGQLAIASLLMQCNFLPLCNTTMIYNKMNFHENYVSQNLPRTTHFKIFHIIVHNLCLFLNFKYNIFCTDPFNENIHFTKLYDNYFCMCVQYSHAMALIYFSFNFTKKFVKLFCL
jgi:hypothetical protein